MAKCSECGFLAARNRDTRELDEVEKVFRENGRPPNVTVEGRNPYCRQEIMPLCFVRSYDLVGLYAKVTPRRANIEDNIATIINEERQCSSFTKWHQGFTPKEHQEMLDKEIERKWRLNELWLIIGGNILAACLGALLVYLFTR